MVMDANEAAKIVAKNEALRLQMKAVQKKAKQDFNRAKKRVRQCQHELSKLGFSKDELVKLGFKLP